MTFWWAFFFLEWVWLLGFFSFWSGFVCVYVSVFIFTEPLVAPSSIYLKSILETSHVGG